MRPLIFLFALLASTSGFAADPIKLCIAQSSGPEAKNWKLQTPIAHRIESEASAKQIAITVPLLTSDDEKHAKSEAREKSCTYVLVSAWENSRQEVYGTFNPAPTGRPTADLNKATTLATPISLVLKYKLITVDGKKLGGATVPLPLKDNPTREDFEEAGRKLVDSVATQVIAALPK